MMNVRPIAALFILGLTLGACATPRTEEALAARTPGDQFPFVVAPETDDTLLAVHTSGVSPNQASAIGEALVRWRDGGGDVIVIRTPAAAPQEAAATAMGEQVRTLLLGAGAPYDKVRLARYDAAGDPTAPLVLGFSRYAAQIPRCGESWDNLSATQSNSVHSNFGCAVSANMAAQVANPRDLVQPRAVDPTDAARSTFQADQFRRGQDTATTVRNNGSVVSRAIQ